MQKKQNGIFTISLDFELYWGMRDNTALDDYSRNLLGVPEVIDKLLKSFHQYDIHATWATVGFLFFANTKELKENLPEKQPSYTDKELSSYYYIDTHDTLEPAYHFAADIVAEIGNSENQEIGTHTYSHYYCLESGQTKDEFYADIEYAVNTAKNKTDTEIKSLVFARNQWNEEYFSVLSSFNILCYRGNEKSWIYNAPNEEEKNSPMRRALRLLDSYVNLTGHNTYALKELSSEYIYNIPASRFLRPTSEKLNFLETFRLNRIKKSMTYAAKNNQLYHLWWHPHNFGGDIDSNMVFLVEILEHYQKLNSEYGMQSLNMREVAILIKELERNT